MRTSACSRALRESREAETARETLSQATGITNAAVLAKLSKRFERPTS